MGYATTSNLAAQGLPATALTGIDTTTQQAALDSASAEADGYLASRFTLPLVTPYPPELVMHVCSVAAWRLLTTRGFNPEAGADAAVRMRFEDAMKWLRDISNNKVHPQAVDSSTASPTGRAPRVSSMSSRGWVRSWSRRG